MRDDVDAAGTDWTMVVVLTQYRMATTEQLHLHAGQPTAHTPADAHPQQPPAHRTPRLRTPCASEYAATPTTTLPNPNHGPPDLNHGP
jgi:hypothetical protein